MWIKLMEPNDFLELYASAVRIIISPATGKSCSMCSYLEKIKGLITSRDPSLVSYTLQIRWSYSPQSIEIGGKIWSAITINVAWSWKCDLNSLLTKRHLATSGSQRCARRWWYEETCRHIVGQDTSAWQFQAIFAVCFPEKAWKSVQFVKIAPNAE